jgi:hypothetical protein
MAGSTYMGLTIPNPGATLGPLYAANVSQALGIIDGHDHSEGNGKAIPSRALRIDGDVPFNDYNLTFVRSVRLQDRPIPFSSLTDNGALFQSGSNLYFRNNGGFNVQITAGDFVNGAAAGSISNLSPPAYATFNGVNTGNGKISWFQNAQWYSRMLSGALEIRDSDHLNPQHGISIQAPVSLAADYALTLPTALPAATSFLSVTSAGQLAAGPATAGGIDTANLKDAAVTAAKLSYTPRTGLAVGSDYTSFDQFGYMKDPVGVVRLQGGIVIGSGNGGSVIATLPAGFRPNAGEDRYFVVVNKTTGAAVSVKVAISGDVTFMAAQTNGHQFYFGGVSFWT